MAARLDPKQAVENKRQGENLTKQDLIRVVSKVSKVSLPFAKSIVDNVLYSIAEIIKEMRVGDRLEIREFGVFEMMYSRAKITRHNPKTMEKVVVPAKRRITWLPSKLIKKELLKLE